MSPNCDATWGPDQTNGSCKKENTAGVTVGSQTANCPSGYSSKPTRWKPACPEHTSPCPRKGVCVRRSFSMGWHTPIFCLPAVRGGRQVSQALQGHPSWGAPCSGAQTVKRLILISRVTAGFSVTHLLDPRGRIQNGVLPALPVTQGLSTQSPPLWALAPTTTVLSTRLVPCGAKEQSRRDFTPHHVSDLLMFTTLGQ